VALGDSTAVARAESSALGTGGTTAPKSPAVASAPVAVPAPKQHASNPVLAVSPGRPLQASAPVPVSSPPVSEPSPSPEPVAATPEPLPAQAPAPPLATTVANGAPGTAGAAGAAGGPGTAGVGRGEPEQSCEGDEYVVTVTFEEAEDEEEEVYGLSEADILIQRLGADGSEDELDLRGDLTDVRSLVATLVSEGNCVQVKIEPFEGGVTGEAVEPGSGAAEPGNPVESVLP